MRVVIRVVVMIKMMLIALIIIIKVMGLMTVVVTYHIEGNQKWPFLI